MKIIKSCVYFLFDEDELVYVGKSTNLHYRIGQHIASGEKEFDRFEVYETEDIDRLEEFMIRLLKPKYNKAVPDSYFKHMDGVTGKKRNVLWIHDGVQEEIPYEEWERARNDEKQVSG